MAFLTLEQIANRSLQMEIEKPHLVELHKETVDLGNVAASLWFENQTISTSNIVNHNFIEAKRRFFNCGWLDEYCLIVKNDRLLDYSISHPLYATLSDNEELIARYAKLRYLKSKNAELSMDDMVQIGESTVWCNTIQFFMSNDIIGIERNLNIIENKTLKKLSKKDEGLKNDYEFFKALHANDKNKMEEVLEKLTSPKIHKKRFDNSILNQYISPLGLGYSKLAWRKGIEVEVKSTLVPKELLPIKPLEKYEIPYDYLK